MKPKVSVAMIAYNIVDYIDEAVQSVLAQQCDFRYELVIADDFSTDGTREKVQQYAEKHPNTIRAILRETNLKGPRNWYETLRACDGEYIANLDGDDYWSDPHKLQKQAAVLDRNPDCKIVFHSAQVLEGNSLAGTIPANPIERGTVHDVLKTNFLPNCTNMYRRDAIPTEIPEWYYGTRALDWAMIVLMLLSGGCCLYLPETMSVYRQHAGGMWSGQNMAERCTSEIDFLNRLRSYPEIAAQVERQIMERYFDLANAHYRNGDLPAARSAFSQALAMEKKGSTLPMRRKLRMKMRLRGG